MVILYLLPFCAVFVFLLYWFQIDVSSILERGENMVRTKSLAFQFAYNIYVNTAVGAWLTRRQLDEAKLKLPKGHSQQTSFNYGSTTVLVLPVSKDNYSYVVIDEDSRECVIIDAQDAEALIEFVKEKKCQPLALLTTHKHWDHCLGNRKLKVHYPNMKIYGSRIDCPPGVTDFIENTGDSFKVGSNLEFKCHITPGHTAGHVVFQLKGKMGHPDSLFTGDFLFLAGIGKLFEGSAEKMQHSIDEIVKNVPCEALIWPGHEYAVENCKFAKSVEPDNEAVRLKLTWCGGKRAELWPTVPSTLQEELSYNPFCRTGNVELLKRLGLLSEEEAQDENKPKIDFTIRAAALKMLRSQKDAFQQK